MFIAEYDVEAILCLYMINVVKLLIAISSLTIFLLDTDLSRKIVIRLYIYGLYAFP